MASIVNKINIILRMTYSSSIGNNSHTNEGTKVHNPRPYILLCIVIFSIMLYV